MHSLISRNGLLAVAVALTAAVWAPTATAKTFVVDDPTDPEVGDCNVAGSCTLRQAILEAVAFPGRDVITFDPAVFPPGAPGTIRVVSPLPIIADPAGTAIDGTGAGVRISSDIPVDDDAIAPNGLVFASVPGVPLRDAAVTNVTVAGFESSGVVICGGAFPECNEDVVAPVVRRVTARFNSGIGILVLGQNVTKARIDESVAADNDTGVLLNALGTIAGTRITRSAMKENEFAGIWIGPLTGTIADLAITDTSASHGAAAIIVSAVEDAAKVSLANVAVSESEGIGILLNAITMSALSVTNVVASRNANHGLYVGADALSGLVLKDVVTNGNQHGVWVQSGGVVGAKISQVTAAGNDANGVLLSNLKGGKLSRVAAVGNGAHGLVLTGSGNVLKQVRAAENIGDGIHLGSPGGANTVTDVSGTANQGAGIYVAADSVGNTIKKNVALGSDAIDLFDANVSCGANVWKGNVFERRNDSCIR